MDNVSYTALKRGGGMQKKRSYIGIKGSRRVAFGKKEKKRLFQLGLCICLFLIIFVSRGNELFRENRAGEKLLQMVQENTDFTAAFSTLGESISRGEPVWKGVETLLTDLFGMKKEAEQVPEHVAVLEGPAYKNSIQRMAAPISADSMVQFLGVEPKDTITPEKPVEEETSEIETPPMIQEEPAAEPTPEAAAPVLPVYDGPDLPSNATMECLALGLDTIITPVVGEVSSGYGYRIHPLTGDSSFHAGVDIAADKGTAIKAFADGKVEFIGESSAYGLYVQLDHGNGVKSFYCHCSELLYGKGKAVEAGQTIALVGNTGDTTGSHLHLELKKEGVLLNPEYYIESVS